MVTDITPGHVATLAGIRLLIDKKSPCGGYSQLLVGQAPDLTIGRPRALAKSDYLQREKTSN